MGTCLQMTLSHKDFDLVEGFILLINKGLSIFLSCDLKFCWANLLDRQSTVLVTVRSSLA